MNRWLPGPGTFNERANAAGPDEVMPYDEVPVDRGGRPFIASNYSESGDVAMPGPSVFGERSEFVDLGDEIGEEVARDPHSGALRVRYPAELQLGAYPALEDFVDDEVADYEIGEVGETPGTGLTTPVGPFPLWVWLAGLAVVGGFWLSPRR